MNEHIDGMRVPGEAELRLALRGLRTTSADDGLLPLRSRQFGTVRCGLYAPITWQTDGHARASGHQWHVRQRGAESKQIVVGQRIHHSNADALRFQFRDAISDGVHALGHTAVIDQAYLALALGL